MRKFVIALALALCAACAHKKAPTVTPTPPPPPADRYIRFTIRASQIPSNLTATVYDDAAEPHRMSCELDSLEMSAARANCKVDPAIPVGYVDDKNIAHGVGGHIVAEGNGYYQFMGNFLIMGGPEQNLDDIFLVPLFKPLPRLQIAGEFFRQDNGTFITLIEASDFNLYARFLAGQDIEPLLSQRHDAGFNTLRVWTAYDIGGIGHLVPRENANYYRSIPEFCKRLAQHGLYVEFTAFTGPYEVALPTDDAKVAHWQQLVQAVQGSTNVLLELVNEYNNKPNMGLPLDRLTRPTGVLASHGSGIIDSLPLMPLWDYATVHWDEPRKVAHNGMEDVADPNHIPVLVNETMRFPDNISSVQLACDSGGGAALLVAGSAFHSVHGKSSEMWDGVELDAAKAWARCAQEVPLIYQLGAYRHRTDLEGPDVIRAYSRVLANIGEFVRLIHVQ